MIIVIGGGPAGRMAAMRLASAGREVTLIEKRKLGGQCVFDGCMLVCALNDIARSIENAAHMHGLGLLDGSLQVDYPCVLKRLEETQAKLAHILEKETCAAGVHVEYGKEAEVRNGKVFVDGIERMAEAVIIATGAELNMPDIPGIDLKQVYTPRSLRTMQRLPKRMVIVGGGISGAEFAYIYAAFGVQVTLVARSSLLGILPDTLLADARRDLHRVDIREHAVLMAINGTDAVESVTVDGEEIPCDAVLCTTGFKPTSPYVTGVARREDGAIITDPNTMETSLKGVYAAGDVCGAPYFTPVSRLQGFAAADAILGTPRTVDLAQIPFAVVLGRDYVVCPARESGTTESYPNIAGPGSYWNVIDASIGHMELTTASDGRILGFASSSPSGGLVGTYLGYLVRKGVTVHEFSPLLEVHPLPDGLYSMIRFS
ncbi:MAG TPA: FAD-dependent oxidoreductase [Methanocorpusculum sp.]|nr:FAD-dependent oxidoreductase [Methanocorpusculum sp.]